MVGLGYDIHQLAEDKKLILGGVHIPSTKGTIAHSDGDVLIHSIIDAMLGAAGLGDIGEHFPDNDAQYKNISSVELLKVVNTMLGERNLEIVNIDATIVLESPKLLQYKPQIKYNISKILNILPEKINIKATTNEKQDSVGARLSIAVYSVCMLKQLTTR